MEQFPISTTIRPIRDGVQRAVLMPRFVGGAAPHGTVTPFVSLGAHYWGVGVRMKLIEGDDSVFWGLKKAQDTLVVRIDHIRALNIESATAEDAELLGMTSLAELQQRYAGRHFWLMEITPSP